MDNAPRSVNERRSHTMELRALRFRAAERVRLRQLSKELIQQEDVATVRCMDCRELWPKTPEFFVRKTTKTGREWWYLVRCRPCLAAYRAFRRKYRAENNTPALRRKRIEERAQAERAAARQRVLHYRGARWPCHYCHESWPKTESFFGRPKNDRGTLRFLHLCIFCRREADRLRWWAKHGDRAAAEQLVRFKAEQRRVTSAAREEWREVLLAVSVQWQGERHWCPICGEHWPATSRFYPAERRRLRSGATVVRLVKRACRICRLEVREAKARSTNRADIKEGGADESAPHP